MSNAHRSLRIAVVTPLPVSGIEGGNERHWRSLTAALISAGHDARLVSRVSPEGDLHEVLSSYAMFHAMDLSDADVVVSGKYPSFMVRHPVHLRHLNHPLRGLYEHYPAHLPTTVPSDLQAGIDRCGDNVDELIGWADAVASDRAGDPTVAFPGPLARAVVQRLDRIGRDRLAAEATVSETVANRTGYVDPLRSVSIIAPLGDLDTAEPTSLTNPGSPVSAPPFLFTFGRLDRAKRFDLIMRSFAVARRLPGMSSVELVVAGDGPLTDELAAAAGPGVRMAGRLTDGELTDHLHRAAAVVLAPVDEDYGLVAAEAMAAATPIIATSDSGGIAEQVSSGRNGLVVHPSVPLLAKAMRDLATNPSRAERMGRAARDAVRPLSWRPMLSLIDELVTDNEASRRRSSVVLVSTFPADPVESGGQRRLRGMASGLARHGWRPTVLSLTNRIGPGAIRRRRTADGVHHVMVGRSRHHLAADFAMASLLGQPVDDVAAAELWRSTPSFEPELRAQMASNDVTILSHPFLASAVASIAGGDERDSIIYDSHNVETDLKQSLFARTNGGSWVAELACTAEHQALDLATVVSASSPADLERLRALSPSSINGVVVPNPLDPSLLDMRSDDEHKQTRRRFLADMERPDDDRPIVLFVGSNHGPNREAARRCCELAALRPELLVVIAGTVEVAVQNGPNQPLLVGSFDPSDLRRLHTMADLVLNPVDQGSGTSLKLIDALALGIPVVSTPIGARGIDHPDEVVWLSDADTDALSMTINAALADPAGRARRVEAGRAIAMRAAPAEAVGPLVDQLATMVEAKRASP